MIIYSSSGNELLNIQVDDSSYRYRSIMGENSVTLYYSLVGHVELPVGSYIEYQGERYTLWRPENFKKHSTRNFEYTVTFGGNQEALKKYKFKLLSAKPYQLKFNLVARPQLAIQLLVDNLNVYDGGWTVGNCIEANEKLLSFNHESCFDVLNRLAEEFDTEWEVSGKSISFCKVEKFKDSPLTLSYGKGNGFKTGVGRTNEGDRRPVTLLYVQGGEKNIDFSKYKSKTLLLPKSQTLSYQGRTYRTDPDGMYITRADASSADINEDSLDCSDIHPKRVGSVTKVEVVDKDGKEVLGPDPEDEVFYDFIDESIPDALDYSACRIAGEKATIIFQSGMLAGKEFDLEQTEEELTGYVHAERRFKLVAREIDGTLMPDGDVWMPAPGDQYAVFGIQLPEAYICDNDSQTGASWDMFREGVRYFYEHEDPSFTFSGELDGIWSKKHWLEIGGKILPGGYVQFSDTQFQPNGVLIRMTGVKDYINKPYSPTLELSNLPVAGTILNDLGKIDANQVVTEGLHKEAIEYTKRRFRDARETQRMLEDAFLDFSKGVNPIWVQTMSLLVGSESLQFRFVDNKIDPHEINIHFVYDDETKVFTAGSGILQHLTLGITDLTSEHKSSDYKFWDIEQYVSPALDGIGALYLYVKCEKDGTKGQFLLSEMAYKMDPQDGYYYFLAGTLGMETDGTRSFATLYEFTEIGPGWMRLNKIISPDGKTYFDVAGGEIGGRIKFAAGSSGLKNLDEWTGLNNAIQNAQNAADKVQGEITDVSDALGGFQETVNGAFKDGIIDEAEAKAIEKYINILTTEKADVDAEYEKLFQNPYLEGEAKANLLNAKISYSGAHQTLINAVKAAISDGKTTIEEKAEVDRCFALYAQALSDLSKRVQEANQAIQQGLRDLVEEQSSKLQELEYLKTAIANETVAIGGLLLTSLLKLGVRKNGLWQEKAGINGTAKNGNDVIAWFGGTLTEAISNLAAIIFRLDGSGQLGGGAIKWFKENQVWKTIFEGELRGVSGSFKELICVDRDGNTVGSIELLQSGGINFKTPGGSFELHSDGGVRFNSQVGTTFYSNITQQGYCFLGSDMWLRGTFGALQTNTLYITGASAYYYPAGTKSDITIGRIPTSLKSGSYNGGTYYKIPIYGDLESVAGFPVDMVIFNIPSGTLNRFAFAENVNTKQVTVINANDKNSVHLYSNGNLQELGGGCVARYVDVSGFMNPAPDTGKPGVGWLRSGYEDNNW